LRTATRYFGENCYEATKLADVAAAVRIGSTALYHYFESKLHCLFVIMADALGIFRSDFDRHTSEHEDYTDALLAVGQVSLDELTEFFIRRQLALLGLSPELADGDRWRASWLSPPIEGMSSKTAVGGRPSLQSATD
jgi:AcrR family transcriptional regulator